MGIPFLGSSRTKVIIHGVQGFIVFLAWAFTIAVFTRDGPTDGRTAWYFALCWITIPALIYLAAIPMWPRTRRFGNAYAFAAVDVLFSILWFAAWVAVATYVGTGKSSDHQEDDNDHDKNNKNKDKENKSGCDAFAYGSPGKCKLSEGTIVLGVFIFLLFCLTAYLSVRNVIEYRRTGTMPYDGSDPTFAAQSKAAFSSNPAHDFDEEDDRDVEFRSGRPTDGHGSSLSHRDDDEYALLHQSEVDDIGSGARPPPSYDPTATSSYGGMGTSSTTSGVPDRLMHDYDTSYMGAYGHRPQDSHDDYGLSNYGR